MAAITAIFQSVGILCVFGLVVIHAHDEDALEMLLKRVDMLESQGRVQQHHIDQQAILLARYEARMTEYEDKLQKYATRIEQLEDQVADHDTKHDEGPETPSNEETLVKNKQTDKGSNTEDKSVDQMARRSSGIVQVKGIHKRPRLVLDNGEGPIAFHATHDTGVTPNIGQNQHILFEDIHLNTGGAFHDQHGLFIAPRSGLYIFSVSIMSAPDGSDVIAAIVKDGATLAKAYAYGASSGHDQGSVSIVTQLTTGDEVWVSSAQRASTSDYGDLFTSFMGCLISEM